jgi:hypothetical protein
VGNGRIVDRFVKQVHKTHCGVASACIVLGAVTSPTATRTAFEERTFFGLPESVRVLDPVYVSVAGMTLSQLAATTAFHLHASDGGNGVPSSTPTTSASTAVCIGKSARDGVESTPESVMAASPKVGHRPFRVTYRHATDHDASTLRRDLREALGAGGAAVVNYHMGDLGQGITLGGHLSPVAAHHVASDRVLLMDVWPATEECWPTVTELHAAMLGLDLDSRLSRGWLIITRVTQESFV